MNDEQLTRAERELFNLSPAALGEELRGALEWATQEKRVAFADRVLAAWTCMGAAAACFVIVMTVSQIIAGPPSVPADASPIFAQQPTVMNYERLLAER